MNKETLEKIYSNYRLYIFPGIVGLSSLFLILFIIYPQTSKLILNQKQEGDLINKTKFLQTKVSALEGYNGEDLSRKVSYALVAYPQDKDFGNVVGLLQRVVLDSGFSVTSINLGGTSSKAGESSYDIKLEVTGVKNLIPTLLNNLESSPRLTRINHIEVSSSINQTVKVSLLIAFLYSPTPQNLGSVDSPLPTLSQKDEELIVELAKTSSPTIQSTANLSTNLSTLPRGKANPFE